MKPHIQQIINILASISLVIIAIFFVLPVDVYAYENFNDADIILPGVAEGTGTIFAVTSSEYLDITLESSEEIYARVESIPEIIILVIEPVSNATSSELTIQGLASNTTYYSYEDDYHNVTVLNTDEDGSFSFTQKLDARHTIFIQPRTSTLFLRNDATGGDCTTIGLWDASTKTCTLTGNMADTIQIDDDDITLDGSGYTNTGYGTGNGVYIPGKRNVTIKNLTVTNFGNGIFLNAAASTTVEGNFLTTNSTGMKIQRTNNSLIKDNVATQGFAGITILSVFENNTLTGNVMYNNQANFYIQQSSFGVFGNSIDVTNTIEGKPIYYIEDGDGLIFEDIDNMGMFFCIQCKNITLRNIILEGLGGNVGNYTGIHLWHTSDSLIENVQVSGNNIGVQFSYSNNNIFTKNTLRNNSIGILIQGSSGNSLYNNNFFSQSGSFRIWLLSSGVNEYYLPLPVGGNYFNTYDEESEGCFDINNDNFCDTPYKIYHWEDDTDDFPWTTQDGWLGEGEPDTDPLILQYEPILYLHPDENYEPMNVGAFVEHSSLWDDKGIFGDILLKPEDITDPVTLEYLATTTDTGNWYLQFSGGSAEQKTYDPSVALSKYNELVLDESAQTTYYARRMEDSFVDDMGATHEYIVLQYWYFYAFNDWQEHNGFNNHEGDWESVMVFLDKETQAPKYIAYSAHHNDGDPSFNFVQYDSVRREWNNEEVQKDGDQVKSFVALGSHANYPSNGDGVHNAKLGNDLTSTEGSHLTSSIWENKEGISSDLPEWVYHYEGKWGADTTDIGSDGPQGPNFLTVGGTERFHNPIKWAGIDKIASKTVATPTDTLSFIGQTTTMVFGENLLPGTTVSVDMHDEFIGFGNNLDTITLLPRFWDIESNLDADTFEATVEFTYDSDELDAWGVDEDDLSVFLYDEINDKWQNVPSSIGESNTISFTTTHFSRYAIGAYQWQSIAEGVQTKKYWGRYKPKEGALNAFVYIKNISDEPLPDNTRLLITSIEEEGVYLINNSGTTTDSMPYINILESSGASALVMLEFSLPIRKIVAEESYKGITHILEFMKFLFNIDVQQRLEP